MFGCWSDEILHPFKSMFYINMKYMFTILEELANCIRFIDMLMENNLLDKKITDRIKMMMNIKIFTKILNKFNTTRIS